MADSNNSPLISGRMRLFLIGMVFVEASRTMTLVQIPLFLRDLGAGIQQIGFFFTVALIFPLFLRILGGWFSDTIGRLRAILIGSISGILAYLAFFITPGWELAILGPAFIALTTALIFPSYKAYIADQTPEEKQGRVFGVSETVITSAWILGPPIGGFIAQQFGYRAMFFGAMTAFSIGSVIFYYMLRTEPSEQQTPLQRPSLREFRGSFTGLFAVLISGGLVTWLLITDGIRDIAFKLSFDLMPIYLSEIGGLSRQLIGLLDGLFGIALVAASYPGGLLTDRTSPRFVVVMGIIIVVISRLVFGLAAGVWGFAFSWILLGVGGGLLDPAFSTLIARGVPTQIRGITYGLLATSLGLISLPSPWIGSQLWTQISPKAPFFITVILGSLAVIPAWYKLRLNKARAPTAEPSKTSQDD